MGGYHVRNMNTNTRTQLCVLGKDVEGESPNLSVVWVWSVTSSKMLNWFNWAALETKFDMEITKIMISKEFGRDVIKNVQPKNGNKMVTKW